MIDYRNEERYYNIVAASGAEPIPGHKIKAAVMCPFCGAYSTPRNEKAAVGNITPEHKYGGWAFHCLVCGTTVSLREFALAIGMDPSQEAREVPENIRTKPIKTQRKFTWMDRVDELVGGYENHPDRFQMWDDYKHITEDAVEMWQLGVGVLPETRHNEQRLITPIHKSDGSIQWIRGRVPYGVDGTKWIGAGGVSPHDIELSMRWLIQPGKPLVIVENYVDALAINHYLGDLYSAVPTFSVSYWTERWEQEIVERKPSQVLVAFDPDLAGNGPVNKEHARELFTDRISKIKDIPREQIAIKHLSKRKKRWTIDYETPDGRRKINLNQPFGLQRRDKILELGIPATVAKWTDANQDIGDFLSDALAKRKAEKK